MKKCIVWLLIYIFTFTSIFPISAIASPADLLQVQIKPQTVEQKSNVEYVTLEWLNKKFQIPQTDLLQQLNKGYSLQELYKALELHKDREQPLDEILNQLNPKVIEELNSMDFAPLDETEQGEKELPIPVINKQLIPDENLIILTGETNTISGQS
ncbi:hypothetical protein SAMN02799630_04552 [Paenibacillus sp. UNCCL117]|uniref:hypothetical protein n=1 Tax=unclassified Paenibacillus TaxID=185978 RepID=UPI00088C20BF|nr:MULTISPECIES: hypothetical protein [unclassified Paenibacillus]SDD64598.1 hypothetical protein SAMN04488602_11188 [Paenibacillus sp. cl123]SFW58290.1 hypothetical protein SAMN02799630_04552 [Paenibacillus sp. UNCCL117]